MKSFTVRHDRYVAFVVTDTLGNVHTFVDFESEQETKILTTADGKELKVFLIGRMDYGFRLRIEALDIVKVRLPMARENSVCQK